MFVTNGRAVFVLADFNWMSLQSQFSDHTASVCSSSHFLYYTSGGLHVLFACIALLVAIYRFSSALLSLCGSSRKGGIAVDSDSETSTLVSETTACIPARYIQSEDDHHQCYCTLRLGYVFGWPKWSPSWEISTTASRFHTDVQSGRLWLPIL